MIKPRLASLFDVSSRLYEGKRRNEGKHNTSMIAPDILALVISVKMLFLSSPCHRASEKLSNNWMSLPQLQLFIS